MIRIDIHSRRLAYPFSVEILVNYMRVPRARDGEFGVVVKFGRARAHF